MTILLMIHSIIRWLIVIAAVAAIVKFALGWLQGGAFQKIDRILAAAFSGLLDLQATLGLIMLLWTGLVIGLGFPLKNIEHATVMIAAAVLGHLPARWKNAADKTRFRNTLFCVLAALVCVYLGVARLEGGWSR
jgi:hypothetical protein